MFNISGARAALLAAALLGAPVAADAAVVVGAPVNGLETFIDTNTGDVWLQLDNFFALSMDEMAAIAQANGFTVADRGDVEVLLNTLPLPDATTWDSYAAIMGRAPNRELMWGGYGPKDMSGLFGWAFAFRGATNWSFVDSVFPGDQVANGRGSPAADQNIWAFQAGGAVPEPATWALTIVGFGIAGSAIRRRRAAAMA